ncbi:CsbD family protein [Streptomyces gardneri]|uniref:CsbD family protein n=1 Tax=Streptomyces gardneri TaxID=66892 RepID=UPI0035D8C6C1
MSGEQKMKAKGERAKGKVKETVGRMTDDERLETEGQVEQAKGHARGAKEKAKDAFKH